MATATETILEEVRLAQVLTRTRLAGALVSPPADAPEASLPTVPLIDLAPSFDSTLISRKQVASQIRSACLTTGFFQIFNHRIPTPATDGVLLQAKRLFHNLTPSQLDTLHVRYSPLFRGYEPGDYTYTNPDDISNPNEATIGAFPETKKAFNWGYEPSLDPTGGDGKYVELDGHPPKPGHTNVWPSESDLPSFRTGVADYYAHVIALARHLFRLFALSLDLEEDYFDAMTTHPGGIGRLIYYPPQPPASSPGEGEKQQKLGLGAHTDYECFTLLLSSDTTTTGPQSSKDEPSSLEILFPPSAATHNQPLWRPCPIRPGTLVINVGDFLQRWTRGLYKSTIHRVVAKPGCSERYSVPLFFSVNYDADVEPLPGSAVGEGGVMEAAGGGGIRAGQYVLERLKATKTLGEGVDDVGAQAGN